MKSKEEILRIQYQTISGMPKGFDAWTKYSPLYPAVKSSMDEYAKEMCIEFAKWLDNSKYCMVGEAKDRWENLSDFSGKTTEQLFNQFISQSI